jgi:hypothetical protein
MCGRARSSDSVAVSPRRSSSPTQVRRRADLRCAVGACLKIAPSIYNARRNPGHIFGLASLWHAATAALTLAATRSAGYWLWPGRSALAHCPGKERRWRVSEITYRRLCQATFVRMINAGVISRSFIALIDKTPKAVSIKRGERGIRRISVTGRELQVTQVAGVSGFNSVGSSLILKLHRFRFFHGAVRVGGN